MHIKQLSLHNFRNFVEVGEIDFPDGLLVAAAPNATGKTNFMESLVMLLRGKSWRATHETCVRWGEEGFTVRGVIERQGEEATVAVQYQKKQRRLRVEEKGVPASPVTFYSSYPFILFMPEDTFLFTRGPAQRRNFYNRILASTPTYVSALVQYQRALKQRNTALKTATSFDDVAAWTELLVEQGSSLWKHREKLSHFFNTHLDELYQQISGEERSFAVQLLAGTDDPDAYTEALKKSFDYEKRYGYTMHGPHRDDLEILTEQRALAEVLSQGQMRSVVIALKLAAHRYIESITGERPLLLLDEVLSELDEKRQKALLANLPKSQILLTCTTLPATLQKRDDVHLLNLSSIVMKEEDEAESVEEKPQPPAPVPAKKEATEQEPVVRKKARVGAAAVV